MSSNLLSLGKEIYKNKFHCFSITLNKKNRIGWEWRELKQEQNLSSETVFCLLRKITRRLCIYWPNLQKWPDRSDVAKYLRFKKKKKKHSHSHKTKHDCLRNISKWSFGVTCLGIKINKTRSLPELNNQQFDDFFDDFSLRYGIVTLLLKVRSSLSN